jgi:two-component system, chemotaxis family, response regulator Rcp1
VQNLISSLNILLAEDNLADARLVREVMREGKFLATLHHVEDGVEAMAFLRRQAPYQDAPRPDLVLAGPQHAAQGWLGGA